jgi:hypothetical protein
VLFNKIDAYTWVEKEADDLTPATKCDNGGVAEYLAVEGRLFISGVGRQLHVPPTTISSIHR